jgi:molybdate transport system regulatory protein
LQLSARNQISGNISHISVAGVNTEVVIEIGEEDVLVAVITTGALKELGLVEGSKVIAIVKSNDVMVGR